MPDTQDNSHVRGNPNPDDLDKIVGSLKKVDDFGNQSFSRHNVDPIKHPNAEAITYPNRFIRSAFVKTTVKIVVMVISGVLLWLVTQFVLVPYFST